MSQPVRNTDELPAVGTPVERPVGRPAPKRVTLVCVLEQQRYRPGDQAPEGYLAWHEWAEVQHKAGLRQKQCGRCGLWRYPQQLSALVDSTEVTGLRKRQPFRRVLETPVCNDCAAKALTADHALGAALEAVDSLTTPNVRANLAPTAAPKHE